MTPQPPADIKRAVAEWNRKYPPGTHVIYTDPQTKEEHPSQTNGRAYWTLLPGNDPSNPCHGPAVVNLFGIKTPCALAHLRPAWPGRQLDITDVEYRRAEPEFIARRISSIMLAVDELNNLAADLLDKLWRASVDLNQLDKGFKEFLSRKAATPAPAPQAQKSLPMPLPPRPPQRFTELRQNVAAACLGYESGQGLKHYTDINPGALKSFKKDGDTRSTYYKPEDVAELLALWEVFPIGSFERNHAARGRPFAEKLGIIPPAPEQAPKA